MAYENKNEFQQNRLPEPASSLNAPEKEKTQYSPTSKPSSEDFVPLEERKNFRQIQLDLPPEKKIVVELGTADGAVVFGQGANVPLVVEKYGLNVGRVGYLRGGQSRYNTGAGFFLGYENGTYKLSIGDGTTANSLTWDGTTLTTNGVPVSKGTFGGDGSDGALTLTSTTTTLSFASASVLVKNYTSISITSTGKLDTSNPASGGSILFLRSQGNITLTASATVVNVSGMGAPGGAGGSGDLNNSRIDGTAGTDSTQFGYAITKAGSGGSSTSSGGATPTFQYYTTITDILLQKYHFSFVGAGGGGGAVASGGAANGTAGAGGRGGGGLVIECGGAWNFTTASGITVAGAAGTNGSMISGSGQADGGGGGGGGFCLVLYKTLTSNSGTIVVSGGAGGKSNPTSYNDNASCFGGGGGASNIAGSAGTNSTAADQTSGGTGANGYSLVALNTLY